MFSTTGRGLLFLDDVWGFDDWEDLTNFDLDSHVFWDFTVVFVFLAMVESEVLE